MKPGLYLNHMKMTFGCKVIFRMLSVSLEQLLSVLISTKFDFVHFNPERERERERER